jgi:hypothetical protein
MGQRCLILAAGSSLCAALYGCSSSQLSCSTALMSCYSGPPNTAGVGVCQAGTQTACNPACAGEVLPSATENCFNDLDDDCDGVVNNGCPDQLKVGQIDDQLPLSSHGGAGGGDQSAICPMGSLVTGVQVQLSDRMIPGYVVTVQPSCATPTLVRGAKAYSIALTPTTAPPAVGGTDPTSADVGKINCATGGFGSASGTQGSTISEISALNPFVESWGINCSVITFALDASGRLRFTLALDLVNSGVAVPEHRQGGAKWTDSCPADEVLIGMKARTGARMDAIQGLCAPLVVSYK